MVDGKVRAMVKVDIRSMAFANDPHITPRGLLSRYADENRLRQYVQRWFIWLHSGLRNKVSNTGGFNRIWLFVLKQLNITYYPISPR